MATLREPIISLLGHVDHGKTTLLDRIAGSVRASKEAGGITQHIGAIEVPATSLLLMCQGILRAEQVAIPGLLFIDTPGHRSFETLRRRGGALADLAILVVDSREGLMPQTRESLQILRHEKTPFAVALTKIDLLPGWRKSSGPLPLAEQLKRSGPELVKNLDQQVYALAEGLDGLGFSADRYDRVTDFTHNVGIVPVSAKSSIGVPELLALVVGLAQRFLKEDLQLVAGGAEATVLERSEQRGIGPVGSVIVYRGQVSVGDDIVVTGREAPFVTRVRGIYRPEPPRTGKAPKHPRLATLETVRAAAGVYISATGIEDAMPGGLFRVVHTPEEIDAVRAELDRESHPVAEIAESGVAIHADTLGGLEALAFECRAANIPIHEAAIGSVGRATMIRMEDVKDPTHRAVLAFNVPVLPDAIPPESEGSAKVFQGDIIYRVVEEYVRWREDRRKSIEVKRRLELVHPAKLEVLAGYVFRSSKPAIVGVRVLGGTLRSGVRLMRKDGEEVGVLRSLQREGESVAQAETGVELAASIDGAVMGRNLHEGDVLLVALSEGVVRTLRKLSLTEEEQAILQEIIQPHLSSSPFWGQ